MFVGLNIDTHVKLKTHIDVTTKISKNLFVLRHIANSLFIKVLLALSFNATPLTLRYRLVCMNIIPH